MTIWLFNPFTYIAGLKSLLIGWLLMLLTAFIASYSGAHFDGALDVHGSLKVMPAWIFFIEQLIAWGSLVITFYLSGFFFSSSSVRFIDVAGTTALARAPLIIVAILHFAISTPAITPLYIGTSLIELLFIIWMIALLFNAFKVSCNIKGNKAVIVFIVSLIVAEIISKVILYYLYSRR
jgi:hypothetical protein